jgi:hypothetical protein
MSDKEDNILRDGTSQKNRNESGLQLEKVLVDGRDMEYFLNFVAKFSEKIRFYDRSNAPAGTWDAFFPPQAVINDFISKLPSTDGLPPQLGLFVAFTQMMGILKGDINQLSKRHLQFYFEKVLRFRRQKAVAEEANIIFEPSPTIPKPIVLPAGLELLAGKDANGNPIIFATDKELTVSKAAINKVSSVFVDASEQSRIYAAPKADSADGIAEALSKDAPYWNPFGESQVGKAADERTMIDGKSGFAIASSMLLLKEGVRKITITLTCINLRFVGFHFDALRTAGIPDAVVDQMQSVKGILYDSQELMQNDIITAIGNTNFTTYSSLILDLIANPFKLVKDEDLEDAFLAEATGEKDWFSITNNIISKQIGTDLRFQLKLEITDPAIVDYNPLVHKQPIATNLPIIQLNLNHASDNYLYDQLRGIKINNVKIELDVDGMTSLVLQNENGPLNAAQAFFPFGAIPAEDSPFYFGSREVFSKKLDSLEMELSWANLPKDAEGFSSYYNEYPTPPTRNNDAFSATFAVLDKKKWTTLGSVGLFKTDTSTGVHLLFRQPFTVPLPTPSLNEQPLPEITSFDPSLLRGFGRLTLNSPDFGHSIFPKVYADKALLKVTVPATVLPNVPYTPKINHLALNYTASISFAPTSLPTINGDQVFHVEPLGITPMNEETSTNLLPQFAPGTFYIGLSNLLPPQNISILFQMVDGSANPDIEVTRTDVKWSYFDTTVWKQLSDVAIQLDTTFGLQTSGIIEYSIPSDASDEAAFWANGLFWLKAEFFKDPSGASKVAALFTNAMVATLRDDLVLSGILKEPLQPGSINKLVNTDPQIKAINQPFSSFNGKSIEPEKEFNRRVSERLRHKNRAVNIWDYEHLVLEAFPSIYKVKSLQHTNRNVEAAPGSVTLLVIPDLRKRNKINPFEPKVSAVIRSQINDYITRLNSGVATVFVDNPTYEQIFVEMSVGLRPGYDGNFYGRLLNDELKKFLSPWAFDEGKDIVFGGSIFKSSILAFVEQRAYVDYVTNFKLFHLNRGPGIGDMRIRDNIFETPQDFIVRPDAIGNEVDFELVASTARSILVTANDHNIKILNPGEFACPGNSAGVGIGAMIIEVDFFVF